MDTLRAPFAAHVRGSFRFYCSVECHARRLDTPRSEIPLRASQPAPRAGLDRDRPSLEQMADMLGLPRESLPPDLRASPAPRAPNAEESDPSLERSQAVTPSAVPTILAWIGALGIVLATVARWSFEASNSVALAIAFVALALTVGSFLRAIASIAPGTGPRWPWAISCVSALIVAADGMRTGSTHARAVGICDAALVLGATDVVMALAIRAGARAFSRVRALANSLPPRARVVRPLGSELRPAARVRAGEEVEVLSGDVVPVDGIVRSGEGTVLLALGTSPASRAVGDTMLAGTRVVAGSFTLLATRAGDDVALARAARSLGPGSVAPRTLRWADRVSVAVPMVVIALALAGALAQRWGGGRAWLGVFALAVAAAPLGLSGLLARVPLADAVAVAGARAILYRELAALETAATVESAVLCVRGTVTVGQLEVSDVVSVGRYGEEELVALACGLEDVAGDQPFARGLRALATFRKIRPATVRRPTFAPGAGVAAVDARGDAVAIGSRALLLAEGVSVAAAEEVAQAIEHQRRTAVFVAIAGRVEGVIGFEDALRADARPAVQSLIDADYDVVLMSGVGRETLEAIGQALDVGNLRPEVQPDERASVVRTISEVAGGVAVVGHVDRDGAALGAADVAVTLRAAGTAGSETGISVASDDLRDAAAALRIARLARRRALRATNTAAAASLLACATLVLAPGVGADGAAAGIALVAIASAIALRVGAEVGASAPTERDTTPV